MKLAFLEDVHVSLRDGLGDVGATRPRAHPRVLRVPARVRFGRRDATPPAFRTDDRGRRLHRRAR